MLYYGALGGIVKTFQNQKNEKLTHKSRTEMFTAKKVKIGLQVDKTFMIQNDLRMRIHFYEWKCQNTHRGQNILEGQQFFAISWRSCWD